MSKEVLDPGAPLDTARLFIGRKYVVDGALAIQYHGGECFVWTGPCYRRASETEIRGELYEWLDEQERWVGTGENRRLVPFHPNSARVSNVADALEAITNVADGTEPAWMGGDAPEIAASHVLACRNVLVDVTTRKTVKHTPRFFNLAAVPFDYDAHAPTPKQWLAFLDSLWPEDREAIDALQEIFGYLLTPDTRQQKIFLLVGPKRSGKGTIARVLVELLGQNCVAAPTLAALGANFGLEPLIGKRLALVADARLGGRSDQQVIAERLLSISGEDAQTIDRKNRLAWTGKLTARFLVLTNLLPQIGDPSGALASRFVVLTTSQSFYGREDKELTEKLIAELPGILNWALDGLDRLRSRGHFVQPRSSEQAVQELQDLGSPISAFVREACEVGPGLTVECNAAYEAWRAWCQDQGRDHPGTNASFGRDLRSVIQGLRVARPKVDGGRQRHYEGLCLRSKMVHGPNHRRENPEGGLPPPSQGEFEHIALVHGPSWTANADDDVGEA